MPAFRINGSAVRLYAAGSIQSVRCNLDIRSMFQHCVISSSCDPGDPAGSITHRLGPHQTTGFLVSSIIYRLRTLYL